MFLLFDGPVHSASVGDIIAPVFIMDAQWYDCLTDSSNETDALVFHQWMMEITVCTMFI